MWTTDADYSPFIWNRLYSPDGNLSDSSELRHIQKTLVKKVFKNEPLLMIRNHTGTNKSLNSIQLFVSQRRGLSWENWLLDTTGNSIVFTRSVVFFSCSIAFSDLSLEESPHFITLRRTLNVRRNSNILTWTYNNSTILTLYPTTKNLNSLKTVLKCGFNWCYTMSTYGSS